MGRIINKRSVLDNVFIEDLKKEVAVLDNDEELTLLSAVCQVVDVVEESEYDPDIYETAAHPIAYISDMLDLTAKQAVVYSIVMNNYYDSSISIRDITRFMSISTVKGLLFSEDLEELCKRKFLIENIGSAPEKSYKVSKPAINSLQRNRPLDPKETMIKSSEEWFRTLDKYITARGFNNLAYADLCICVDSLVGQNTHLPMIQTYMKKDKLLRPEEKMLFWWVCNMVVLNDFESVVPKNFRKLFSDSTIHSLQVTSLAAGTNGLIKHGLLRPAETNECNIKDCYELTPWVINEMLDEFELSTEDSTSNNLVDYTKITPKQLYYNEKENAAIEQLTSLLQPARFTEVCGELQKLGFRKGFACLLHGAPGTGKTETVMQLARATGRNIMKVDISTIKSKWVGESEKNIKEIFTKYRRLVEQSDIAPILLFNEADAIIGKRMENVSRSVDKMENSMQNIILEEIEKLEGILIATTNLTSNLDPAFERRFLYKIEFQKPTAKVKSKIWQSMISGLSATDAEKLATTYDFSGGQIENIARKNIVARVITGKEAPLSTIISDCDSELIDNKVFRRVGFTSAL